MKRSIIIIVHFAYWICYTILVRFVIYLLNIGDRGGNQHEHFLKLILFAIAPAVAVFYIAYSVLFEKLLRRNKILTLCLSTLLIAYLTTSIAGILLKILIGYNILFDEGFLISIPLTFMVSSIPLVHAVFGLGMRAFISWFDEVKLKEELSKKNYETELALVKSQIDPHFLFNTINNIDSLIEIDSTRASNYLNKLSDIMRFMLYETKTEKIPIAKELQYIEKYIELQKIRSANRKYVTYELKGDYASLILEPMLFIPFIENAFKHAENIEDDNAIVIIFNFEKGKISFLCENRYSQSTIKKDKHSGLGNELIKKRLLLLFPENHTLEMEDKDGIYKIQLIIKYNED
jgi:two-component system LytT family sensor kinase